MHAQEKKVRYAVILKNISELWLAIKEKNMEFQNILEKQQAFFKTHQTKDLEFRREQLRKLADLIKSNQSLLYDAIYKDFGKSRFDTFATEIAFLLQDIRYYGRYLNRLARPKTVKTNLANQIGRSKIYSDPLGKVLVIGAWNYPYQLSLAPMVAAMAAGNTCLVKPSELAPHSMAAMAELINSNFQNEYLFVAEGGVDVATEILKLKFDKIFFTGSPRVGRVVYEAAAKHLTPVTLELGGKSPVIVTANADLDVAAKRIVWGKFLNAGQTCVAPDYLLVDYKIKDRFLQHLQAYIEKFAYGAGEPHYTQIVNARNFERLIGLIRPHKVYYGGTHDAKARFIGPTLLDDVAWDDPVMEEEIFGPILPVLTYQSYYDALDQLLEKEKPLAAYLFTNDRSEKQSFTSSLSFGGGCINDVVMHLANSNLPFGGVGNSGMGRYHGKFGFDTFSHQKPVMYRATWGEPNVKYPPYTDEKLKWMKRLI